MRKTHRTVAGLATGIDALPDHLDRIAPQDGRHHRVKPLMRKYDVAYLTPTNHIDDFTQIAPASTIFEDCFAAIGRGAIVQTDRGPTAVEDLLPGLRIKTSSNGFQKLKWVGRMMVTPGMRAKKTRMTRLTQDALGYAKPVMDLVLGPSARLLHTAPGVRLLTGDDHAFVPVRDFIDGASIIDLYQITAVPCYHLGFDNHEIINVSGVEIETLHPGLPYLVRLHPELRPLFMALFPHKKKACRFRRSISPAPSAARP